VHLFLEVCGYGNLDEFGDDEDAEENNNDDADTANDLDVDNPRRLPLCRHGDACRRRSTRHDGEYYHPTQRCARVARELSGVRVVTFVRSDEAG
jgi:hypothetical protein